MDRAAMGREGRPQLSAETVEEVISRIRGVTAARVTLTPEGTLKEIHIIATQDRSPKQIVRDIESACEAQFHVSIDHRVISVAQLEGDESSEEMAEVSRRLRLHSIGLETEGNRVHAVVRFIMEDRLYEGVAKGVISERQRWRPVAEASLRAIEEYVSGACSFVLDDVIPFSTNAQQGFVVTITMSARTYDEPLVGSSLVRKDEAEALAKAVLDAVNRRLTMVRPASTSL